MTLLTAARAVYHHCQDKPSDCGRAAAQMVISSLVQSPFAGSSQPAPAPGTPIAVTQETLRLREFESDDYLHPVQWYTHPDELLVLLRAAPEYVYANDADWRLVNRAANERNQLFAEIVHALQRGMPSIININANDHWVVVTGAEIDPAGNVLVVQMRDPQPVDPRPHTYIDGCNDAASGETYGAPWVLAASELGNYHMEIGDVPPPPGLTDYSGQLVALIHGNVPDSREIDDLTMRLWTPTVWQRPGPPVLDPAPLVAELARIAGAWNLPSLSALLERPFSPVLRAVHDIEQERQPYTLLTMFDAALEYGIAAVFLSNGSLSRLRFVNRPRLNDSLRATPDERLWWTVRPLPALGSPLFPFRRSEDRGIVSYRRLYDDFAMTRPPL